jgi:hypothetical protein
MSEPTNESADPAVPDGKPDDRPEDAKGPTVCVVKTEVIGGLTIVDVEVVRPE